MSNSKPSMRAAWYSQTGAAKKTLEVGSLPKPAPQSGEVLVRIRASGVNPSDAKKRSGARGTMQYPQIIPHSDGAGVIEFVGAGVDSRRIGERVWLWNAQWNRAHGTAAEYICLPEQQAVALPENLSFEEGACLGIPALTAYIALDINQKDAPLPSLRHLREETVLITGANGAVAHYAIGFAKSAGARVIATASHPDKALSAKQMDVDLVMEHAAANPKHFCKEVVDFTQGEGVGRIVTSELGTLLQVVPEVIAAGGVIATYGSEIAPTPKLPFYPLMFKNASLECIFVYEAALDARRRAIEGITHHLACGAIPAAIDRIYPLDEIIQAHERVESGGKIGMVLVAP